MSVSRKVLRKMKKVMGVISTIPVLASCSSQISRAEVNVGFDPCNKVLYFSGKDGVIDKSWKDRYSPESIKCVVIDDGIKKIGDYAFCDCESLKEVTIPNSVTSIGVAAFLCCESLQEINIPNSVNIIERWTFSNCTSLKEITIPNSVHIIDEFAFAVSGLERVKFEDMSRCNSKSFWTVLLRENAFGECKQLRILDLGNNTNISSIANDDNMSRIAKVEKEAFRDCDPNFVALEGSEVRGKFYSTVLS